MWNNLIYVIELNLSYVYIWLFGTFLDDLSGITKLFIPTQYKSALQHLTSEW